MRTAAILLVLYVVASFSAHANASDLQCPSIANMLVSFAVDTSGVAELDPAITQNCHAEPVRQPRIVTIGLDAGAGFTPTYFLDPSPTIALQFPFSDNRVTLRRESISVRTNTESLPQVGTRAQSRLMRCLQTRQFLQGLGLPGPVCNLSE